MAVEMRTDVGVVVPLRSFTLGKVRLADVLDEHARSTLARRMADQVVHAASGFPIAIVSSAPEVTAWAGDLGLVCLDDPGSLDLAADAGREWARAEGYTRVLIVHADLPFATSVDAVTGTGGEAVIVPDQRDDGTPVMSIPIDAPFRFAYGPGSFERHVAEAARVGLVARIVRDENLGFDVDLPEDLTRLTPLTPRVT